MDRVDDELAEFWEPSESAVTTACEAINKTARVLFEGVVPAPYPDELLRRVDDIAIALRMPKAEALKMLVGDLRSQLELTRRHLDSSAMAAERLLAANELTERRARLAVVR